MPTIADQIPDTHEDPRANETRTLLGPLFERAKTSDEFEYACSLLRIRGMQSAGWDPVFESMTLIQQMSALSEARLEPAARLRLWLLLYMHTTEMSMPYHLIGNMLRVTLGDRYRLDPFIDTRARYPSEKIAKIKEWAEAAGFPDIGPFFDRFFSNVIRNAFAHSDYVIHGNDLNLTGGPGLEVNGIITHSIPINVNLIPRLEGAVNFALALIEMWGDALRSYSEPKVLQGRIGPGGTLVAVELMADVERGLYGFQSPPRVESSEPLTPEHQ